MFPRYRCLTFDYKGNFIPTEVSLGSEIYYNKDLEPEDNRLAFIRIDARELNSQMNDFPMPIHFEFGGNLSKQDEPYLIYDYNSGQMLDKKNLNKGGKINLNYDTNQNVKIPMIKDGFMNLLIMHPTSVPERESINSFDSYDYIEYKDVNYGDEELQKMDVKIPNALFPEKNGVVMTIHGGDWSVARPDMSDKTFSDKSYYDYLSANILSEGKIHVNLNYRLNRPHFSISCKEMLEDIDNALYLLSTDSRFNKADMSNLCLWGYSAGAHLAMLYSFNDQFGDLNIRFSPNLLISEGGPYDLTLNTAWLDYGVGDFSYRTIMGKLIGKENVTYDDLEVISPKQNVKKVPEFTIVANYSNDEVVDFNNLNTLFECEENINLFSDGPFKKWKTITPSYHGDGNAHTSYKDLDFEHYYSPFIKMFLNKGRF